MMGRKIRADYGCYWLNPFSFRCNNRPWSFLLRFRMLLTWCRRHPHNIPLVACPPEHFPILCIHYSWMAVLTAFSCRLVWWDGCGRCNSGMFDFRRDNLRNRSKDKDSTSLLRVLRIAWEVPLYLPCHVKSVGTKTSPHVLWCLEVHEKHVPGFQCRLR